MTGMRQHHSCHPAAACGCRLRGPCRGANSSAPRPPARLPRLPAIAASARRHGARPSRQRRRRPAVRSSSRAAACSRSTGRSATSSRPTCWSRARRSPPCGRTSARPMPRSSTPPTRSSCRASSIPTATCGRASCATCCPTARSRTTSGVVQRTFGARLHAGRRLCGRPPQRARRDRHRRDLRARLVAHPQSRPSTPMRPSRGLPNPACARCSPTAARRTASGRWSDAPGHKYPDDIARLRKQYFSSEDQLMTLYLAAPSGAPDVILPAFKAAPRCGRADQHPCRRRRADGCLLEKLNAAERAQVGHHLHPLLHRSTTPNGS